MKYNKEAEVELRENMLNVKFTHYIKEISDGYDHPNWGEEIEIESIKLVGGSDELFNLLSDDDFEEIKNYIIENQL